MRKIVILFFASLLIIVESCTLAGIFDGTNTGNGEAKKFIIDGFSLPAFAYPEYTPADGAELPVIANVQMFQVGQTYNYNMYIINPEQLALNYELTTDSHLLFENIPTSIVTSGTLNDVKNNIIFPFRFNTDADKNDINFTFRVWSALRPYATPNIKTIRVNTRPSRIIPKSDNLGTDITGGVWAPVISGNQAVIYFDYIPWQTDTDISHIEVEYKIGNSSVKTTINYDNLTHKFGDNSYTVSNVPAGSTIDFKVNVFDDEELDSGYVSTGDFVPLGSPDPVLTRGTGASINDVTVDAEAGSTLYCKIDSGSYTIQTSPFVYTLTGTHTISAYTSTDGLFDSKTVSEEYSANYFLTYDGNSSTSGSVPIDGTTYLQGEVATVFGNTGSLTRTGYRFVSWNTNAGGTGTDYDASDQITIATSSVTLYARWVPTYNVIYNGNGDTGGSAPIDTTYYIQGETATVLGNVSLVRTDYRFIKWNTAANGSGTDYVAGNQFAIATSSVTLYAQWVSTYNVIYNGNGSTGGSAPTDSTYYIQGETATVLGNVSLIRTDYRFIKWNTAANGSGIDYVADNQFAIATSSVTLYAQWAPTYRVFYNGNGSTGGSAPTDTIYYIQGEPATVLDNVSLIRTDYRFSKWNTAANGSGIDYVAGNQFAIATSSVTLYAQWAPTYRVFYNGNGNTGGSIPTDTTYYIQGETATVYGNTGNLYLLGRVYGRWDTNSAGTGTNYSAGNSLPIGSSNITLYAEWDSYSYTVTYNSDGGSYTPTAATVATPAYTLGSHPANPTKAGFRFWGWWTGTGGTGALVTKNTIINNSQTINAYWLNVNTAPVPRSGTPWAPYPKDPNSPYEDFEPYYSGIRGFTWGGLTFWTYTEDHNYSRSCLVAWGAGEYLKLWLMSNSRYIGNITVDSGAKTVTFYAQSGAKVYSWDSLYPF